MIRSAAGRGISVLTALGVFAIAIAVLDAADARLADASMRGNLEAVRALVQQGADVNATQPDGMTALHWAARRDDVETATLLLKSGAKAEAATRYGVLPLYLASVNGSVAMLDLLLKAGADVNAVSAGGETPLMTAEIGRAHV